MQRLPLKDLLWSTVSTMGMFIYTTHKGNMWQKPLWMRPQQRDHQVSHSWMQPQRAFQELNTSQGHTEFYTSEDSPFAFPNLVLFLLFDCHKIQVRFLGSSKQLINFSFRTCSTTVGVHKWIHGLYSSMYPTQLFSFLKELSVVYLFFKKYSDKCV